VKVQPLRRASPRVGSGSGASLADSPPRLGVTEKLKRSLDLYHNGETALELQADAVRQETLRRLAVLQGRILAARAFITTATPASDALIATVAGSLDAAV